jgi:hypothetical protein
MRFLISIVIGAIIVVGLVLSAISFSGRQTGAASNDGLSVSEIQANANVKNLPVQDIPAP